jgi:RHS repeat-associated protein
VIKGTVNRTYDNDLLVSSLSVNSAAPAVLKYDTDGLLAQAGALTLNRDPGNGAVTGTVLGKLSTAIAYNGFGECKRFAASFDANDIFVAEYEYDAMGRVTKQTESIGEKTTVFAFKYDSAGRLSDVSENDHLTAHFEFDSNGNRLKYKGRLGDFAGTYDPQDRILSFGDAAYVHSANGEWASKTEKGKTTAYDYDVLGGLRNVTLPDGAKIEYIIDGAGRRVGKKINGALIQGFLYENRLRPAAELDGNSEVISRFVYGTRANVPEYVEKAGGVYRIIADRLGSPRLVVDVTTGEVVQRMAYDESGRVLEDTNPGFQPFGFAGGIYDVHCGLVRFGARDYDPTSGRWTAKDAIRFAGGAYNLYSYAANSPQQWTDPTGLSTAVFDRGDRTLTVFPGLGATVHGPPSPGVTFPAGNNTTSASNGPWPNGTYNFTWQAPHPESGANGSYGSNGNWIFDVPNRTGMGIHAGRAETTDARGGRGTEHVTEGCIRTTDDGTDFIRELSGAGDPLSTLTVQD